MDTKWHGHGSLTAMPSGSRFACSEKVAREAGGPIHPVGVERAALCASRSGSAGIPTAHDYQYVVSMVTVDGGMLCGHDRSGGGTYVLPPDASDGIGKRLRSS